MKINKNKKMPKRRIVIASSITVALLLAAWAVFAYASSSWPFAGSSQTTDSQTSGTSPLETNEETNTPDSTTPSKAPTQYEGNDPNNAASLTGFISYSSVVDGNLVIRTTIDQALSSGTCKLTLTKGGESITKTSDIVANPSSSTCSGFDIPTSELSSGTWTMKISITSGNKTGTITGETTI